jgi:hypothetical protein
MAFHVDFKKIDWLSVALVFFMALLIWVVACATCHAQSMRRDSLRVAILDQLLLPTNGTAQVTTARINRTIGQACAKVCNDFPAIASFDTIAASGTTEGMALNADFNRLYSCYRMVGDTQRIPLIVVPEDSLPAIWAKSEASSMNMFSTGSPRYCYVAGSRLFFWPKYNKRGASDNFFIEYFANDTTVADSVPTTRINPKYRDAIIWNACVRVSTMRKLMNDAATYDYLYSKELAISREDGLLKQAGVQK